MSTPFSAFTPPAQSQPAPPAQEAAPPAQHLPASSVPVLPQLQVTSPNMTIEQQVAAQVAAQGEGGSGGIAEQAYDNVDTNLRNQVVNTEQANIAALTAQVNQLMAQQGTTGQNDKIAEALNNLNQRMGQAPEAPQQDFSLSPEEQAAYGDALPTINKQIAAAQKAMRQEMEASNKAALDTLRQEYEQKFNGLTQSNTATTQQLTDQSRNQITSMAQGMGININQIDQDPAFNAILDGPINPMMPASPQNSQRALYSKYAGNPTPEAVQYFNGLFNAYVSQAGQQQAQPPAATNPYNTARPPQPSADAGKTYKLNGKDVQVASTMQGVQQQLAEYQTMLTSGQHFDADEAMQWSQALTEKVSSFMV